MTTEKRFQIYTKEKRMPLIHMQDIGRFGDSSNQQNCGKIFSTVEGAPIIKFDNGDTVVFSWGHLIEHAKELLKKEKENG